MPELPESIGPYRILAKIGEGGMGVVYKAQDQRLKRIVALKVIREFDSDATRRQRFWQEARTAAQVAHPNACRIYDIAEEQDRLVLVMEFIEGESLAERIRRGPLPAQEAAQIVLAILSALEAFHAPAWARLGRARWLMDKYNLGSSEGLRSADEAFQTALRLSPDLTMAHNIYTQLQVDQGRALDALKRLLDRARRRRSDPELFAGLGHVCRYCGLLQAALRAQQEARRLDPLISTTINHTYFMLGDYQKALEFSGGDFGYALGLTLATLGRTEEAITKLRQREEIIWRLGKLYLTSLRALLEGHREESLQACEELRKATFRDPEGIYYLAPVVSQRFASCLP
jgi:tetratricopeptide (TPR) repeat protein